jgi:YD repeat-containing protein
MGRLGWVLGLGLCVALMGCEASHEKTPPSDSEARTQPPPGEASPPAPDDERPSVPDGGTPSTDGGSPSTDGGTPPTDGGTPPTDGGTPSPDGGTPGSGSALEGVPSLAPAACIPWTQTAPPQEATACDIWDEYSPRQHAYSRLRSLYDANGHLLESRAFLSDGTPYLVETHTWANGLEVSSRVEAPQEGWWNETHWTYDAQRRVQQHTDTSSSDSPREHRYNYDSNGRLERMDHLVDGTQEGASFYLYNAMGLLQSIESEPHCDRYLSLCERFTYWPNGQLRSATRNNSLFWELTEHHDAHGRLIDSNWSDFDTLGSSTRAYDAAGHLTRLWEKVGVYNRDREALTTFVYDSSGLLQLQRFAQDSVTHAGPTNPEAPDVFTHQRVTRRVTYLCGTPFIALEEWDSNEDGVPDARRIYERDATGRLVHEEYSGTPDLDDGPVRRDLHYDCH